jgi:hypothetical protein
MKEVPEPDSTFYPPPLRRSLFPCQIFNLQFYSRPVESVLGSASFSTPPLLPFLRLDDLTDRRLAAMIAVGGTGGRVDGGGGEEAVSESHCPPCHGIMKTKSR